MNALATLSDLVTRSQKLAAPTKELYLHAVEQFVAFAGEDPAGWTPMRVEDFRDHLISSGIQPQSANTYLHGIRYVGRRWEAMGMGVNFARAAEYARVEAQARQSGRRQALVEAELQRLLEATSGDRPIDIRDRAIVVIGIRAGGRRASELAGLTWDRVEYSDPRVPTSQVATFRVKGGYDLSVPLDVEASEALSLWHRHLSTLMFGQPAHVGGPVFRSLRERLDGGWQAGEGMSRQAIWGVMRKRGEQAGLKRKLHPHILRWTFISMAEAAGMSPADIMRMTGHRSLQTLSGYISKERFEERSLNQLPAFTGPRRK